MTRVIHYIFDLELLAHGNVNTHMIRNQTASIALAALVALAMNISTGGGTLVHEFVANHDWDPTGYKTLMRVLGVEDMERFKDEWESWVMSLSFP